MINTIKKHPYLTVLGFLALLTAAGILAVPGTLIRWREREMIRRLGAPGSPTAEIRFKDVAPKSLSGPMRTVILGHLLFRLPRAWTMRTGESRVGWSREYWIGMAIGKGSGRRPTNVLIKMSPKLIHILPNPWWKSPGYGSDFVKPWYHSAEAFFSWYPTPLSFDEALARTPAAVPRAGSRVSIRRRGLLLLCKPGLGGRDIYEVKTGRLTVIFSLHDVIKHRLYTRRPSGMPGPNGKRVKGRPRGNFAARLGRPDSMFDASLSLYDCAGQWRDVIQARFNGVSRHQAFSLARGIISGLSFAMPGAPDRGTP